MNNIGANLAQTNIYWVLLIKTLDIYFSLVSIKFKFRIKVKHIFKFSLNTLIELDSLKNEFLPFNENSPLMFFWDNSFSIKKQL